MNSRQEGTNGRGYHPREGVIIYIRDFFSTTEKYNLSDELCLLTCGKISSLEKLLSEIQQGTSQGKAMYRFFEKIYEREQSQKPVFKAG